MRSDLRVVRIGVLIIQCVDVCMCHLYVICKCCLLKDLKKTKNGYKIRYLVGDQLLDCIRRRYRVLDEASDTLAVSHLYLNTGSAVC